MFTDITVWFCILTIFISKSMCSTIETYWRKFAYTGPVTFNYYISIQNSSVSRCTVTCWTLYNWDQIYFQGKDCYCLAPIYEKADKVSGTVTTNRAFLTAYYDVTTCSEKGYTLFLDQRYCLKLFSTEQNFTNAESTCRQDGGHLVSVYTEQDLTNLGSVTSNDGQSVYHVGAHRTLSDTEMVWITGGIVKELFWYPGEPDNDNGEEDCVMVYIGGGQLVDVPCIVPRSYICQLLTF